MRSSVVRRTAPTTAPASMNARTIGNLSGPRLAFGGAVFHPYTIGLKSVSSKFGRDRGRKLLRRDEVLVFFAPSPSRRLR